MLSNQHVAAAEVVAAPPSRLARPLGAVRRSPSSLARSARRPRLAVCASTAAGAAAPPRYQDLGLKWAVEVTRQTLTMPQVLQHLEQLERIDAHHAARNGSAAPSAASTHNRHVSWVEHSTSTAAALMEGIVSDDLDSKDQLLSAVAALPPHLLTEPQQAAIILQAWESAAHTKPDGFDADTQLMLPGLADVAVVSRGGWQRHSWKTVNQDSFLALPLAAGSAACQHCATAAACCSSAVAIGVFDGHGRAGQAASSHLRNALASGLLMHNQLAMMAQPACQQDGTGGSGGGSGGTDVSTPAAAAGCTCPPADPAQEAAQLLERCFAAAASTMPSTGSDFSLSGSTAVMCLVQPGSVTAAWAGDSRAVLGLLKGHRYIACALTSDHKPSSPLERGRIETSGGWVMQTMLDEGGRPAGPHRVYLANTNIPGLAVSRCFGDYVATAAGVTSIPDVTTLVLPTGSSGSNHTAGSSSGSSPQHAKGQANSGGQQGRGNGRSGGKGKQQAAGGAATTSKQRGAQQRQQKKQRGRGSNGQHVLVVASDGLWEFISNAEAVRIASRCSTAKLAAEALALEAQAQWAVKFGGAHCDDITVACAFLPASA